MKCVPLHRDIRDVVDRDRCGRHALPHSASTFRPGSSPGTTRSSRQRAWGVDDLAVYDYLGYYNICNLGDEVKDPGKTIPLAVNRSIWISSPFCTYTLMKYSILGVIPYQEVIGSHHIAADVMGLVLMAACCGGLYLDDRLDGGRVHVRDHVGLLPDSAPAARNGDFFAIFARLHPRGPVPGRVAAVRRRADSGMPFRPARDDHQRRRRRADSRGIIGLTVGLHLAKDPPRPRDAVSHAGCIRFPASWCSSAGFFFWRLPRWTCYSGPRKPPCRWPVDRVWKSIGVFMEARPHDGWAPIVLLLPTIPANA